MVGIYLLCEKLEIMEEKKSIKEQLEVALDGRSQRWLSFEVRIAEAELSKKINGGMEFTDAEIERINKRLNCKISK